MTMEVFKYTILQDGVSLGSECLWSIQQIDSQGLDQDAFTKSFLHLEGEQDLLNKTLITRIDNIIYLFIHYYYFN